MSRWSLVRDKNAVGNVAAKFQHLALVAGPAQHTPDMTTCYPWAKEWSGQLWAVSHEELLRARSRGGKVHFTVLIHAVLGWGRGRKRTLDLNLNKAAEGQVRGSGGHHPACVPSW